jgi:tetratricopeptide (TPR) repeat protein
MQKTNYLVVIALFTALIFSGFQCSSTELTSAKLYIQQKNYDKALNTLHKEVAKNPKSDEGWYLLGNVYGELGKFDSLVIAYDKSLAVSKKYESEINQSKMYYWANSFNAGVSYFQRGNKATDKDSVKIYYDKSIDAFTTGTKLEPDSADTFKNLAFVYMSAGKNEEAIKPLKKLVQLNNELDGYKYLGQIYYTLGTMSKSAYSTSKDITDSLAANKYFNDAVDILEKGTKLYPNDSDLLKTLSASYVDIGKSDVALNSFKTLVEKEPDNKVYRYNYGVLLLGSEDYEMAVQEFQKAIDLDSTYTNAIYNLGITYVKWGSEMNKESLETEEYSDAYKEKFKAALPYLEKVTATEKSDAEAWELLGKVYSVLGMQDKAIDAFNHADQLR